MLPITLSASLLHNISTIHQDNSLFTLASQDTNIPYSCTAVSYMTLLFIRSNCKVQVSSKELFCFPGNILLFKGACEYSIEPDMSSKESEARSHYLLNLSEDFFDAFVSAQLGDCPILYDMIRLQSSETEYLLFDCNEDSIIEYYVIPLLYECSLGKEADMKSVKCAFILFMTKLHFLHHQHLVISESTMMTSYNIGSFLKYMTENYATVTLSDMAAHFNFHPNYFSNLFKSLSGYTFSEKLLIIKLEQAKRLLLTTDLSVQDITELIGFREKSYFHKCFKRYYGTTPARYRKDKGIIN